MGRASATTRDAPESWPLVSIGIPLCRSRRFLDVIAENLECRSYPNLEILIAEDSPTQAIKLQMILESNGYRVTLAENTRRRSPE